MSVTPARLPRGRGRLPFQFLVFSTTVVAAAMVVLGIGVSNLVGQGIVRGVAETATASIESFISHSTNIQASEPLSADDEAALNHLVFVAGEASSTRLLDVRLWQPDGKILFQGVQPLQDEPDLETFDSVRQGNTISEVVSLTLSAVGQVEGMPLRLLRVYTPMRREDTGEVVAIAAYYFGSRALLAQQAAAQQLVWIAVPIVGFLVVGILFAFVLAIDRRITRQERQLMDTLTATETLATQNDALRHESESLRLDAIEANESLLARVGADIHDGPLQLLTLVQMRLSRNTSSPPDVVDLTKRSMDELRALSAGLVLPELENRSLAETIDLAVERHQAATGTRVAVLHDHLDFTARTAILTAVYRIVQQALTNAAQHADGKGQSVRGTMTPPGLAVEIRSASKPHATAHAPRPRLGLRGMRLRAEGAGGHLETEFGQEETIIRFTLPLSAFG